MGAAGNFWFVSILHVAACVSLKCFTYHHSSSLALINRFPFRSLDVAIDEGKFAVDLTGTRMVLTLREQPILEAPRLKIVPVVSQGAAPRDIFLAHLANAHVHMWGSVAQTSRRTYALGWARWHEFVSVIGTDFAMARVPQGITAALEGLS